MSAGPMIAFFASSKAFRVTGTISKNGKRLSNEF